MEAMQLAQRAVACKHWRWMDGMKLIAGPRLLQNVDVLLDALPDLDDPATLGCLLALVLEAYGIRLWLASSRDGEMWYVDAASGALSHGKTEAAALVAALEAAP